MDTTIFGDATPTLSAVVRAEEPAFFGFDQCPDALRLRRRDHDADLAPDTARQSVFLTQFDPVFAAICRLEEPAARSAAGEAVWASLCFPQGGEHNPGVGRVERQV